MVVVAACAGVGGVNALTANASRNVASDVSIVDPLWVRVVV